MVQQIYQNVDWNIINVISSISNDPLFKKLPDSEHWAAYAVFPIYPQDIFDKRIEALAFYSFEGESSAIMLGMMGIHFLSLGTFDPNDAKGLTALLISLTKKLNELMENGNKEDIEKAKKLLVCALGGIALRIDSTPYIGFIWGLVRDLEENAQQMRVDYDPLEVLNTALDLVDEQDTEAVMTIETKTVFGTQLVNFLINNDIQGRLLDFFSQIQIPNLRSNVIDKHQRRSWIYNFYFLKNEITAKRRLQLFSGKEDIRHADEAKKLRQLGEMDALKFEAWSKETFQQHVKNNSSERTKLEFYPRDELSSL